MARDAYPYSKEENVTNEDYGLETQDDLPSSHCLLRICHSGKGKMYLLATEISKA